MTPGEASKIPASKPRHPMKQMHQNHEGDADICSNLLKDIKKVAQKGQD